MKSVFFLITAIFILLTVASGKGYCQSTYAKIHVLPPMMLIGSDSVTIDWGNGRVDNFVLGVNDTLKFPPIYSDTSAYAMIIVGKGLKIIDFSWCKLASLDISRCTKLEHLTCYSNRLTSLDVSKNTALISLFCGGNQLTNLDVSKNTALKDLFCSWNQLTTLEIGNNTVLEALSCFSNQLTNLDVSKNTALKDLNCANNQLKSLDISGNIKLEYLDCFNNQIECLDVSKNIALLRLNCGNNNFSETTLNEMFKSLPYVSVKDRKKKYKYRENKYKCMVVNSGTDTYDKTIAEKKGWEIIEKKEY